jgi:putative transposase
MRAALGASRYPVSRNKARYLIKDAGVLVTRREKFKVTTDSNHVKPLFDNVLGRDVASGGPDQVYVQYSTVQDITHIWTQEGWLY